MRRHGRVVRWGKWAATVCGGFMLAAWAGSVYAPIKIGPFNRDVFFVLSDCFFYGFWVHLPEPLLDVPVKFEVDQDTVGNSIRWWPIFTSSRRWFGQTVQVALWPIVLALSVVAAWLWCVDRRYAPGYCGACGYDLTGNESGVCPECGMATSSRGRKPADHLR